MLDSKVISVRLGGIYALQRLAQEHPKQVKDKEAAREAQAEKKALARADNRSKSESGST